MRAFGAQEACSKQSILVQPVAKGLHRKLQEWCLESGISGFHHALKLLQVGQCAQTRHTLGHCMLSTSFLLAVGHFSVRAGLRTPTEPAPEKTLDAESLVSFSGRPRFMCAAQFQAGGMKPVLGDSCGRGLLAASAWFPPALAQALSPFADFALHPVT